MRVKPLVPGVPGPDLDDPTALHVFPDDVLSLQNRSSDPRSDLPQPLRQYNPYGLHKDHPKTIGVPVAWSPWDPLDYFEELDESDVKKRIDASFRTIKKLIEKHEYRTLTFRASEDSIFAGEGPLDIRRYITAQCLRLATDQSDG